MLTHRSDVPWQTPTRYAKSRIARRFRDDHRSDNTHGSTQLPLDHSHTLHKRNWLKGLGGNMMVEWMRWFVPLNGLVTESGESNQFSCASSDKWSPLFQQILSSYPSAPVQWLWGYQMVTSNQSTTWSILGQSLSCGWCVVMKYGYWRDGSSMVPSSVTNLANGLFLLDSIFFYLDWWSLEYLRDYVSERTWKE